METALHIARQIALAFFIVGCLELAGVLILDARIDRRKRNGEMD